MSGEATPAQIGALLMAMRVRGETVAEITGAVRAMRARMTAIAAPADAIDVCGTGGDGAGTLNVSTAVTFVVAGCGVPVAKHGNRALSSRTGGADVLTALGRQRRRAAGAAAGHPARGELRLPVRAAPPPVDAPRRRAARRARHPHDLQPARAAGQSGPGAPAAHRRVRARVGAADGRDAGRGSAARRAWIVHGQGLDELTVAGENQVAALAGRRRAQLHRRRPRTPGLPRAPVEAIRGGDAALNAADAAGVAAGRDRPYRDTVLLNAAAALIVAGRAGDLREGVALAGRSIASGAALAALETLRRETSA